MVRKGSPVQVRSSAPNFFRGSGGIGRRARLRALWEQSRKGSSPFFRTNGEPWCSWLTHRPVTPEIAGSSPVGSAIPLKQTKGAFLKETHPLHQKTGLNPV